MMAGQPGEDSRYVCPSCFRLFANGGARSCTECGSAPPPGGWPRAPYAFRGRYLLLDQVERGRGAAVFRGHGREGEIGRAHV